MWKAGCRNATQAWRDIKESGYAGPRDPVARWFQVRRTTPSKSTPARYLSTALREASNRTDTLRIAGYSPRQLAWLMVKPINKLSDAESTLITQMRALPEIQPIFETAQGFIAMVRQREPKGLNRWLSTCEASKIPALVNFSAGIRKDYAATRAALGMPWSNGQTEGQVTRLKLIKRQMYGRAKLDWLRLRFLGRT
jgi:transposase